MEILIATNIAGDKNFVALGCTIDRSYNNIDHLAFILYEKEDGEYEARLQECDYDGWQISLTELTPTSSNYYFRISPLVKEQDVEAFIAMCENVKKNAKPEYGYFYSGESYDKNGVHQSSQELGQRMTCVGFCLNILKGFLEEDYIEYADWDSDTNNKENWLDDYCQKHNIDPHTLKQSHRRITPLEGLVSCFFENLPIRKSDIDSKKPEVIVLLEDKSGINIVDKSLLGN